MFPIVLKNLISLCLIIGVGVIARKAKIINDEISTGISNILLRIALPSTIIMSMQQKFSTDLLVSGGTVLSISFGIHFSAVLVGLALCYFCKVPVKQKGIWLFVLCFGNVSYMGFPIISAIYGKSALFYVSMNNVAFNILIPSLGIFLLNIGKEGKRAGKGFRPNEAFIASIIGLLFFLLSFELPEPVGNALSLAGSMTTPLSMLIIGGLLAKSDIKSIFGDFKIYILAFVRLLAVPAVLLFLLRPFIKEELMLGVIIYLSAMPAAASTAIFAEQEQADAVFASKAVFITTILSLLTIPVMSLLLS